MAGEFAMFQPSAKKHGLDGAAKGKQQRPKNLKEQKLV